LALVSQKQPTSIDEAIARLKAADELDGKDDYQAGWKAGEEWARSKAKPKWLRSLQRAIDWHDVRHGSGVRGLLKSFTIADDLGIGCGLLGWISPKEERDMQQVDEFWSFALGRGKWARIEEFYFALGFCEGALDVWAKVKDCL